VQPQAFIVTVRENAVPKAVTEPLSAIVAAGVQQFLALPFVAPYYSQDDAYDVSEPLGTVPTKAHHNLILPDDAWDINECGYRMLTTEELKRAMGFPDPYIVLGSDELRTKQIGNAVTPPVARLLGERMFASLAR
jgi:DNA (cytosine-5)-methyltransferase 1